MFLTGSCNNSVFPIATVVISMIDFSHSSTQWSGNFTLKLNQYGQQRKCKREWLSLDSLTHLLSVSSQDVEL